MPSPLRHLLLAPLALLGCEQTLKGPTPSLEGASPALVCNDQLTNVITVTGEGLAPLPTDVLEEQPTLVLPALSITLGGGLYGEAASGEPVALDETTRWIDDATMEITLSPEMALPEGVYDLRADAPDGQVAEAPGALALAPPPVAATITPDLVCLEQGEVPATVAGEGFLVVEGQLPSVTIGSLTLSPDEVSGCADLSGPVEAQGCAALALTLPQDGLETGVHEVTVANPAPAECTSAEPLAMEVVPAPVIDAVIEDLECVEQSDQVLVLTGSGFLVLADGTTPTVTVGATALVPDGLDGCAPLAGPAGGQSCTSLTLTLPQGAEAPGVLAVSVANPAPADCVSTESVQIELVDRPVLDSVDPELACVDQADQVFTLSGSGFLVLADGTTPKVQVGSWSGAADAGQGCVPLLGPAGGERCDTLVFTLPAASTPEGSWEVVVTNPGPADCSSEEPVELDLYGAPVLSGVDVEMTCNDQNATALTLTGEGFLTLGGELPTVSVGAWSGAADSADGCVELDPAAGLQSCTTLQVEIAAGSLPAGLAAVSVTNPDPLGCSSSEEIAVEVVGAPLVSALDPSSSCYEAPTFQLDVVGQSFLVLEDGTLPSVTIGDERFTPDEASGCAALEGPAGGSTCTALTVTVPEATWTAVGSQPAQVTNPAPAECVSNDDVALEITPPPEISGVEPETVCDSGETVTIRGSNFVETPTVEIDGVALAEVVFVDDSTLEVTLPDSMGAGLYDVTVTNPDGCSDTATDALELVAEPLVLFVDPQVTYSGISVRGTVYVSGVNEDVVDVWIVDPLTGETQSLDFEWSPADADEILATIPSGLAEERYDLYIEDGVGCRPGLEDAFRVESDLTVAIASVDPAFAYTGGTTAVEVYATDPADAGYTQFEDTPRVYLTPSADSGSTTATELYGVTFQDATLLDAIVPEGLQIGAYDLLVVNPDGQVGLLADALQVMSDPPPEIYSLSPGSVDTQDDYDLTLYGANLDAAAVDFECVDKSTGATFTSAGTLVSTAEDEVVVTIASASDTSFTNGVVCVVVLTNADGASVSYSSLSVTNPSANLYSIEVGSELTTGRRAPATAALRATSSSRYLYAIGGDSGSSAGALDTIERVKVGKYGELEEWEELPDTLDDPRTLASVVTIGRYVYLIGGNDGSGAVDTLLRAQVLDPLEAPRVEDVEVELADALDGLGGGTWSYRVAALYPAGDDDNPGGESLAGDPYVMRLPDLDVGLYVTLSWEAAPGARGYRIYRSPVADAGSGAEEWIADVRGGSTTTYTDTGAEADPELVPLPKGALGQWATLEAMSTEREGACAGVGVDPSDESVHYIYVAGGRDAAGNVLDSVEWFDVTVVDEHDHEGGSWRASAYELAVGRWQCGAYTVGPDLHSYVPADETWIYVGAGLDDGDSVDSTLEAFLVGSGGDFAAYYAVDDMRSRAGYAVGSASNQLYAFGGSSAAPDDSADSAQLCTDGMGGCRGDPPDPPDLKNWNSLGLSLNEERYLPGSAQESSVFFIVGGETASEAASTTVDWANY